MTLRVNARSVFPLSNLDVKAFYLRPYFPLKSNQNLIIFYNGCLSLIWKLSLLNLLFLLDTEDYKTHILINMNYVIDRDF